jgi:hypothetical protein
MKGHFALSLSLAGGMVVEGVQDWTDMPLYIRLIWPKKKGPCPWIARKSNYKDKIDQIETTWTLMIKVVNYKAQKWLLHFINVKILNVKAPVEDELWSSAVNQVFGSFV